MTKRVNTTASEIRPLSTSELDAVCGAANSMLISLKSLGIEIYANSHGYGVDIDSDGGKTTISHWHTT
jgi:hypothetical protein